MMNYSGETGGGGRSAERLPVAEVGGWLTLLFLLGLLLAPPSWGVSAGHGDAGSAGSQATSQLEPLAEVDEDYDPWADDPWGDDPWNGDAQTLADPLEPLNRFFFAFNDRLYRHALNPVATGYAKTVPEDVRLCVRSFFRNLLAPVRIVNNLLQGQLRDSGTELARFAINTTIGIGGLVDSASRNFGIEHRHADLGQTLGIYGFGDGFYLHWPFLGPSSLRDSVGMAGDGLINPVTRLMFENRATGIGMHTARTVNATSLRLGEYERLKEAAFDPYLAIRDAYWQYRRNLVRGHHREPVVPAVFGGSVEGGREYADKSPGANLAVAHGELPVSAATKPEPAAVPVLAELWPEAVFCSGGRYFLHVGAYLDRDQALREQSRLGEWAAGACLLEHDRGDYRFYGLLIPVGEEFVAAKEKELKLAAAGRDGWLVTALSH